MTGVPHTLFQLPTLVLAKTCEFLSLEDISLLCQIDSNFHHASERFFETFETSFSLRTILDHRTATSGFLFHSMMTVLERLGREFRRVRFLTDCFHIELGTFEFLKKHLVHDSWALKSVCVKVRDVSCSDFLLCRRQSERNWSDLLRECVSRRNGLLVTFDVHVAEPSRGITRQNLKQLSPSDPRRQFLTSFRVAKYSSECREKLFSSPPDHTPCPMMDFLDTFFNLRCLRLPLQYMRNTLLKQLAGGNTALTDLMIDYWTNEPSGAQDVSLAVWSELTAALPRLAVTFFIRVFSLDRDNFAELDKVFKPGVPLSAIRTTIFNETHVRQALGWSRKFADKLKSLCMSVRLVGDVTSTDHLTKAVEAFRDASPDLRYVTHTVRLLAHNQRVRYHKFTLTSSGQQAVDRVAGAETPFINPFSDTEHPSSKSASREEQPAPRAVRTLMRGHNCCARSSFLSFPLGESSKLAVARP